MRNDSKKGRVLLTGFAEPMFVDKENWMNTEDIGTTSRGAQTSHPQVDIHKTWTMSVLEAIKQTGRGYGGKALHYKCPLALTPHRGLTRDACGWRLRGRECCVADPDCTTRLACIFWCDVTVSWGRYYRNLPFYRLGRWGWEMLGNLLKGWHLINLTFTASSRAFSGGAGISCPGCTRWWGARQWPQQFGAAASLQRVSCWNVAVLQ